MAGGRRRRALVVVVAVVVGWCGLVLIGVCFVGSCVCVIFGQHLERLLHLAGGCVPDLSSPSLFAFFSFPVGGGGRVVKSTKGRGINEIDRLAKETQTGTLSVVVVLCVRT